MKRFILIFLLIIVVIYLCITYLPIGNKELNNSIPQNGENSNPDNTDNVDADKLYVQNLLDSMSVEEKVGQLFIAAYRKDNDGNNMYVLKDNIKEEIQKYHLGGITI